MLTYKVKQKKSSENTNKASEKILTYSFNTNAVVPMTLRLLTKSARAKQRFGTVTYWKYMYDQS